MNSPCGYLRQSSRESEPPSTTGTEGGLRAPNVSCSAEPAAGKGTKVCPQHSPRRSMVAWEKPLFAVSEVPMSKAETALLPPCTILRLLTPPAAEHRLCLNTPLFGREERYVQSSRRR